jgi:uncharacterized protein (TIGR02598 family)
MKYSLRTAAAFSLVEVTLALGVAAFCLVAIIGVLPVGLKTQQAGTQQTTANAIISQILGDLRADVRLPPGQQAKSQESTAGLGLHGHWAQIATPDTLYFTLDARKTGDLNAATAPPDAAFRATITYRLPPTDTTSLASITISWPAAQSDLTKVAGSVETLIAVNR